MGWMASVAPVIGNAGDAIFQALPLLFAVGEHNGTFRGFAPAFVTAAEAIRTYWSDDDLERSTIAKGAFAESALNTIVADSVPAMVITPRCCLFIVCTKTWLPGRGLTPTAVHQLRYYGG